MEPVTTDQRRQALRRYAQRLESLEAPAPLDGPPLPYDTCPRLEEERWRLSRVYISLSGTSCAS